LRPITRFALGVGRSVEGRPCQAARERQGRLQWWQQWQ